MTEIKDMKEKREVISKMADLLAYKVRSGQVSVPGGDVIWKIILEHPEKADRFTDILEWDDMSENEIITQLRRLV